MAETLYYCHVWDVAHVACVFYCCGEDSFVAANKWMLQSKVNVKTLDQRYRAVRFHLGDIMECGTMCCVLRYVALRFVFVSCRVADQPDPRTGPREIFGSAGWELQAPTAFSNMVMEGFGSTNFGWAGAPPLKYTPLLCDVFCQALAHPYSRFKISVSCSTIVLLNASSACRRIRKGCDQLTVLSWCHLPLS